MCNNCFRNLEKIDQDIDWKLNLNTEYICIVNENILFIEASE